jgi:NAD kinase
LVIPESSDILIHLPEYARSNARISFDGKKALRMRKVRLAVPILKILQDRCTGACMT